MRFLKTLNALDFSVMIKTTFFHDGLNSTIFFGTNKASILYKTEGQKRIHVGTKLIFFRKTQLKVTIPLKKTSEVNKKTP